MDLPYDIARLAVGMFCYGTGVDDVQIGLFRPWNRLVALFHEATFVSRSLSVIELAAQRYVRCFFSHINVRE